MTYCNVDKRKASLLCEVTGVFSETPYLETAYHTADTCTTFPLCELRGDVKIHWQSLQTFAKACWQNSSP